MIIVVVSLWRDFICYVIIMSVIGTKFVRHCATMPFLYIPVSHWWSSKLRYYMCWWILTEGFGLELEFSAQPWKIELTLPVVSIYNLSTEDEQLRRYGVNGPEFWAWAWEHKMFKSCIAMYSLLYSIYLTEQNAPGCRRWQNKSAVGLWLTPTWLNQCYDIDLANLRNENVFFESTRTAIMLSSS